MDVKITFYRMLIFSVVTALLIVSIFAMRAATTYAQTLTGVGGDNTTWTTTGTTTPPEDTSPLTFTLRMGESGGGMTSTTAIPPSTNTSTAPSSRTTTTPSSPTTSDTTGATATTTSTATSNNLLTRNIGIEVILVRGNEAPSIILPINITIPANVNNLDLCASAMAVGATAATEICQPVLLTIDLTQNGAAAATDTTASGTTTSSSSPSPFSSPFSSPPSSSSSATTTTAPTTTSSFPPTTTTGSNSLIGGVEDTAVNIPIIVVAPISAQIQNARLCAQLPSGTQSCNQIILNPEQTAYNAVNVDMAASPTPTVISSSEGAGTTTSTGAASSTTTTGTTDTAAGGATSSSSTTTTTIPTSPSTTTPSTSTNNNTTNTTGGATSLPPLGDILGSLPPGATTSSDGTIGAFLYANPPTFEGYCPPTIEFSGGILDNVGNRDITYRFVASNGDTTSEQVIHLDEPGGHVVKIDTLIEPPVNWVAIEILEPIAFQSNRAEVQITCTPDTTASGGDGTITATLSANPATYEGPCPVNIDFTGTITDNVGNRDIRYRTIDSRGFTGAEETIRLNQGESETIFPLSASIGGTALPGEGTQGWVAIEFLEPYHFVAGRAAFDVICTAPSTGGAGAPPPPAGGADTIAPSLSVPVTRVIPTTSPTGEELVLYDVSATDNVDGTARLGANNMLVQEDNIGGSVTISCNPPSNTNFRLGDHTVRCNATDAAGNIGTASFIISVTSPITNAPPGGTSSGTITAYLSANPATYNGPCPATIEFSGTITDYVGNRDVIYRFIFSDGSVQDNVLRFNQPGSQSVSTTRPLGDDPGESLAWGAIQILQPTYLQSNRAEIEIACTPSTGGAPPAPQSLQAENTTATDDEDTPATTDQGGGGDGDDSTDGGTPPATTDEEGEEGGETEPPPATTDGGGGGDGTDGGDEPPAPATDQGGGAE